MRVASKMLLDMPVMSEDLLQEMEELGIPEEDATYQMAILVAMLNQAMSGNVKAACFCRDIIGESPGDQLKREVLKLSKARFEHQKVMDEKAQDTDRQKAHLAEIIQAAYEARLRKDRLDSAPDGDGVQTMTEGA